MIDKNNEIKEVSNIKKAKVYTMPSKFYVEDSGHSGKESKNTILIIAIVFLVIAIGAGAVYILLKQNKEDNNPVNQPIESTNLNTNTNINSNINVNINTNDNSNSNQAVNNSNLSNMDSNVFINTNSNININSNLNVNSSVKSGRDTDFDDLTDVEEVLFGTNSAIADTDSDGFEDGLEIAGGYDPNSTGKLANSNKVRFYSDNDYNYSVLYPTAWAVDADPMNIGGKIFTSGDEFITINIQENPAELSAVEWYIAKSPGINSSLIKKVTNWDKTLTGALSLDEMTVYYTVGSKAYVISYNINILNEASYKTTFTMMYKSFINSVVENNTTGVNTNTVININNTTNINTNTNTNSNTNSNKNTNINTNTNTNNNTNRL